MQHEPLLSRPKGRSITSAAGFLLLEVILASALFVLLVTSLVGAFLFGQESGVLAGARARAAFLAEEGLEAVRNMRDENFTSLTDGAHGLAITGGQWGFSGTADTQGVFTRQVTVAPLDATTKQITVTVTWQQSAQRQGSTSLSAYLTNWRASTAARGGIVVYGDGGAVTDAIRYSILDGAAGLWGGALLTADIDPTSDNKALMAAQVFASATRNEKIILSRHSDGTSQFIYAQVFNGSGWGSVVLLSNWATQNFLDVQNFSGAYLANGDFMAVYSDNTTIPKFRVWNGSLWTGQMLMPDLGGIPTYVVIQARPASSEIMAAFFDQNRDTNTAYFNGGAYLTSNWTLHAQHSANAPVGTKQLIDFAWSPNASLKGGLIYSDRAADAALNMKVWTANGTGGGSWSATADTTNQASRLGAVAIAARRGADEFIACDKDANASPRIICYKSDAVPVWTNPSNQTVAGAPPGTDTGIQRSYHIAFESAAGTTALAVYAENLNAAPKLKKYNAASASWDASATNLPVLQGALKTVRMIPHPENDDIMVLLADANQDVSSIVWDGASDALYTTPVGKAFTAHGTNGAASENFWYDFAWDKF